MFQNILKIKGYPGAQWLTHSRFWVQSLPLSPKRYQACCQLFLKFQIVLWWALCPQHPSAASLLYTEQIKPQAVTFLHSPYELTLKRAVLTIYAYFYLHFYYTYLFCVYCMHVAVHLPQHPWRSEDNYHSQFSVPCRAWISNSGH